jgi:hypothetical protein
VDERIGRINDGSQVAVGKMSRVQRLKNIITREFERASGKSVAQVVTTSDEEIVIICRGGCRYVMQIGSDDDQFMFVNYHQPERVVTFPFPADWK